MGGLVEAMSARVQFPMARWQIMDALASLSDGEYQQKVWIRHEFPHPNYYDCVELNIHILFDDWVVLPDPSSAVGAFLVDGPEVGRLRKLGTVFSALIDELGDADDATYIAHGKWNTVMELSSSALSAMVLAGGVSEPERMKTVPERDPDPT